MRYISLIVFSFAFATHCWADANQDLVDLATDTEEMSADSEAARAQAKAAAVRAAKEREVNAQAMKEVVKARSAAETKRTQAHAELKKTEGEIRSALNEQAKIKAEMLKLEKNNAANEKMIQESQAKAEKLKKELVAAQELRAETLKKTAEVNKQKDEILKSTKAIEQQHNQAQLEFKQASEAEKLAIQQLEKATVDETQKKNRLQTEIAKLKERNRRSRANITAMEGEKAKMTQANVKLEQTVKAGQSEVQDASAREGELNKIKAGAAEAKSFGGELEPDHAAAKATVASDDMVLKRDCNARETAKREAKFLGVKRAGTNIHKTEDLKDWIGFQLSETQKAYLLKSCF